VEDLRVFEAFSRAWDVLRAEFGQVILMGLILGLGGGLVGLLLAAPFLAALAPLLATPFVESEVGVFGSVAAAAFCVVAYLPFLLLAQGILTTFIHGAWTLTYKRLSTARGLPDYEANAV
jgi:hypothetical protein